VSVETLYAMAKENPAALLLVFSCLAMASLWRAERRSFQLLVSMTAALGEMGRAVSVASIISEEQMDYLQEKAPRRASRVRAKVRAVLKGTGNEGGSVVSVDEAKGAAPGGASGTEGSAGAAGGVPGKAGQVG
jgi:hypothetical protein